LLLDELKINDFTKCLTAIFIDDRYIFTDKYKYNGSAPTIYRGS